MTPITFGIRLIYHVLLQSWREPISWVQYIIGISEKTKRDQLCKFNAWCMSGTKVGAKKQSRLSVVFALNCWFVGPVARVGDSCPCPCPRSTLNKHGRSAAASLLSTCLGNWAWPALNHELLDPASKYKIIHVQILQYIILHVFYQIVVKIHIMIVQYCTCCTCTFAIICTCTTWR